MKPKQKKIILAISGGVDSAVSAHLLSKSNFAVLGVYFRLSAGQEKQEAAARKICRQLGIKFYPLNISEKFRREIIEYFIKSYQRGLTPNPCVKCNQAIKFAELDKARKNLDADFMATGHYAKILRPGKQGIKNIFELHQAEDKSKDQSYFLCGLKQNQLARIIFPLAAYRKTEVKKIAKREKLSYLEQESQDICFLADKHKSLDHNQFLKKYINQKPGPIMTLDKKTLGRHQGLFRYTIGQRKGVEIGGTGPYYAARKDNQHNILYVVKSSSDPALFSDKFRVYQVNWIAGQDPDLPVECGCSIRYGHKPVKCVIQKDGKNKYAVIFDSPQRAVTPGQCAVFYEQTKVLGGGTIL